MGKIVRYNILSETHSGENNFFIHRPNVLGNPFTHIKNKKTKALTIVKTREIAISKYEEYFDMMLKLNETFRKEVERLYEAYMKYDVVYLGCYCNPNEPCHGDIISKKIQQIALKNYLRDKGLTDKKL